jgi:Dyp-type peroxidase family
MGSQRLLAIDDMTVPLDEIQGDILIGLQKKAQIFLFFKIEDKAAFRVALKEAIGHVTFLRETAVYESAQPGTPDKAKVVKANIAFSHAALTSFGLEDTAAIDPSFVGGAIASAAALGDRPETDWLPAYASEAFDGVLLVAAWDPSPRHALTLARDEVAAIKLVFGSSILEAHREENKVREGTIGGKKQSGHEHFGFADGVSQPGVLGMTRPVAASDQGFPGQDLVEPGEFVIGLQTESGPSAPAPGWAINGSYMVVRRLRQDVTGFYSWAAQTAHSVGKTEDQFTAGLVGRWKDGSPLARNPVAANPAEDEGHPDKNNDFEFGPGGDPAQANCPFQAHIRRVYPRQDIGDVSEKHRILRAGIAYGEDEDEDKGLFFVCYQNSIRDKFEFIQSSWCNDAFFPNTVPPLAAPGMQIPPRPGIDLIIGQGPEGRDGTWSSGEVAPAQPKQFVTSTGAAYFFSPSRTTLTSIAEA